MAGTRIDIHPHVISPDTDTYPLAPVDGKRSEWSANAKSLTPHQLIAAMDAAGIAKAAVVHSSTTYGFDNSLVADAVAAYPDRLTGVCSVDVLAPDAVTRLQEWMARGCTGLRLFTTGTTNWAQAQWLDDPATFPVWEFAAEAGLPICLQVRIAGLDMVRGLMDRFPRVPVILDHLAHPDLRAGPPYTAADPAFALASYAGFSSSSPRSSCAARATAARRRRVFCAACSTRLGPNASPGALTSRRPPARSPIWCGTRRTRCPSCRRTISTGSWAARPRGSTRRWRGRAGSGRRRPPASVSMVCRRRAVRPSCAPPDR